MDATIVDDAEALYRSIRANSDEYSYQNGTLFFSSAAFDDRDMTPSVDRSSIRTDPADARRNPTDGVAKILGAVRNAVGIRYGVFPGNMKLSFQAARSIG
jgi:hypothetical protein